MSNLGRAKSAGAGLAAIGAVAATYVYFLLFAEFALLRLAESWTGAWPLRVVMAILGIGGVVGSTMAAVLFRVERARIALATGFIGAAAAAVGVLAARSSGVFVIGTALVGFALGWLTVTLAAALRLAVGGSWLGQACGVGTGLAYAACNLPAVFEAPARVQTIVALVVALGGAVAARWFDGTKEVRELPIIFRRGEVAVWVVMLLALVWMDSAAFYVIQHTAKLKATTWSGAWRLAGNAVVHLIAAMAAGRALDHGRVKRVMAIAAVCLLGACALLSVGSNSPMAAVLYTSGVSVYSTALVWFPARSGRAGVAALVYAVAGWGGSALGIGMAQDLARIPSGFVITAAVAIGLGLFWQRKRVGTAALVGVALLTTEKMEAQDQTGWVERGREVYIAEGCIHCHSQYVRPAVAMDVERWGPATNLVKAETEQPPLFGNRRQGPDLAMVGARRSAEWQRLHLKNPRALMPGSRMPAYQYLFAGDGERGEALVAYLSSLGADGIFARREMAARWQPPTKRPASAAENDRPGPALFARWCAECHGARGRGDGPVANQLSVRPPDWTRDRWRWVAQDEPDVLVALARIIKFGLPGSPMAGHEYFTDEETVALAQTVAGLHNVPSDSP